jgi:hypothetical protein
VICSLQQHTKVVLQQEAQFWTYLTFHCMSEESDNDEGTKARHTPNWPSQSKQFELEYHMYMLMECFLTTVLYLLFRTQSKSQDGGDLKHFATHIPTPLPVM